MLVDIHGKIKSLFFFPFIGTFVLWYDKWYICQFVQLCFFVNVLTLSNFMYIKHKKCVVCVCVCVCARAHSACVYI